MPNPSHHQTNKSQFADDPGQWAVSKDIDQAVEHLQRDLDKLAKWCAKWRIELNPEQTKVIIFSKSQTAIRAEPALSLYSDFLLYYPHIKFLGITFDNRVTFTKRFEKILEFCNHKFHCLTILQIYKQCIRHSKWNCFYHNCFGFHHQQNTNCSELFLLGQHFVLQNM